MRKGGVRERGRQGWRGEEKRGRGEAVYGWSGYLGSAMSGVEIGSKVVSKFEESHIFVLVLL